MHNKSQAQMTKNIINSVTVPAGSDVDLPKKIASLTG